MNVWGTVLACTLCASAAMALPVSAQQYPSKAVRIIVPAAPGGGTDLVARVLAQHFTDALGQSFVVDNRGGAGTTLGATLAAKAPPDGYTLLLHHSSLAFNATFYRKLQYDAMRDFAPITLVASQPFLVVVHPSLPVRSVKDLIALAHAKPGALAYGSGGAGSGPYMATELLKQAAKIDILHVPYKGAGPGFTDLIGGQIQLMVATISIALPHARSGRVRALAVTSARRIAAAPELPTAGESGLPGYEFATWYGLLAPAGTAANIISVLNAEAAKAVATRDTRDKFATDGLETFHTSPEGFSALIRRDIARWEKVVRTSGVYAD
jgi:tripartite-type tricarboxylate transporter receptor subunit TctC